MKKIETSIITGLFIALFIALLTDTGYKNKTVRDNTLRLHVIARSEDARDIRVKTKVKERVNALCSQLLSQAECKEEAVKVINDNLPLLRRAARQAGGPGQEYICRVKTYSFPPSVRQGRLLPGGEYTALTVEIGRRQGKNRWRVIYPGFSAPGCAVYETDADETTDTTDQNESIPDPGTLFENENIKIKLKIAEIRQEIKERFSPPKARRYDRL